MRITARVRDLAGASHCLTAETEPDGTWLTTIPFDCVLESVEADRDGLAVPLGLDGPFQPILGKGHLFRLSNITVEPISPSP